MSMQESGVGVKYTVSVPSPAYRILALQVFAAISFASAASTLRADDGAASIAAGGIVMVREPRITMQKEVLRISASRVQVDYEFRNDTDKDITTEIAFPVPAYSLDWDERTLREQDFEDFQLTVEDRKTHFDIETKAKHKGRDVSAVLKRYGIDIATFGHFDEESHFAKDVRRLTPGQRAALVHAGLLYAETDQDEGLWSVEKKYYWSQTFPAHAIVHISHQYTPVLGSSNTIGDPADYNPKSEQDADLASLCPTPALIDTLKHIGATDQGVASVSYVDFILTTANTWKTPIEDFTLTVERPKPFRLRSKQNFVSFCWDGPVTKIDANHFSAHLTNFIPRKEVRVGFITPYERSR